MKKRLLSMLLVAAMAASLLVGCGSKDVEDTQDAQNDAAASTELEEKVVVYSAHPDKLLEIVKNGFEEKTGVTVEILGVGGELAQRARSEKDNPQADVIYGQDTATYMALKEEGVLAPTNPSWADELDDFFKDPDGYWYGTIKTPVMMFYNTDIMTAEEAPKDWKDLADDKYEGNIIIRGTAASSTGTTISCWLDYFSATEDEQAGWDFITAFDENVLYYDNIKSLIMQAVGKGEAAIGISTLNDIYDNVINNGLPLQEIYSESGDVVLADCAAVLNNCANPNAAAAFLEYIGSPEVQAQIANECLRCPTLDSALANSPEWMQNEIKALDIDWVNISENKVDWLQTWAAEYMNAEIKSE